MIGLPSMPIVMVGDNCSSLVTASGVVVVVVVHAVSPQWVTRSTSPLAS